jgi:pimeloyl-ACP methyl ester carboxylesterase
MTRVRQGGRAPSPYLARHGRLVTFDRRGSGRSDRPGDVRGYDRRVTADDALAAQPQIVPNQNV